ncbi:MAG TPA: SsrA-binding protein SmpB [Chitinophagales bacterium]
MIRINKVATKSIQKIEIFNRKASFEYEVLERYTAGIVLSGSEIKSIRENGASIGEAYCYFRSGELFVRGMNIPIYDKAVFTNHDPLSVRKLLLRKRELEKMETKMKERGMSIIPLKLFSSERGFLKAEIGLCRGKKSFDKRESIKAKDNKRELDRVMKKYK